MEYRGEDRGEDTVEDKGEGMTGGEERTGGKRRQVGGLGGGEDREENHR